MMRLIKISYFCVLRTRAVANLIFTKVLAMR